MVLTTKEARFPGRTPEMPPPRGENRQLRRGECPPGSRHHPQPPPTGGGPHRPSTRQAHGPQRLRAPEEMTIGTAMTGRGGLARAAATRRWRGVAGLIATVLVAGGAGAAIALAVSNHGTSPRSSANRSSVQQTNGQGLNVRSIAAGVEPATVDITAKSSAGDDEGTGIVISPSGMVLTNNHVIDQSTQLSAEIDGTGKTYNVAVLGTDAADDVALLQLQGGSAFKAVALGNSGQITVGDPVVAIGNALGLSGPETVTNGIISATGRAVHCGR